MPFDKIASRNGSVYRLEGQFGPDEARAVVQELAEAPLGSVLSFDFSKVRDFQDLAFGAVAEAVRHSRASAQLHGLGTRQRRILRYLGVELTAGLASFPLPMRPGLQAT